MNKKNNSKKRALRTITIGGKDYPCRVTMGAMLRFKRATGHDISEINNEDMEEVMIFLHSCVMSACKADGVPCEMTMEEMADLLTSEDMNAFFGGLAPDEKKTVALNLKA